MPAPPSEASQKGNKLVQTQLNVPKNVHRRLRPKDKSTSRRGAEQHLFLSKSEAVTFVDLHPSPTFFFTGSTK